MTRKLLKEAVEACIQYDRAFLVGVSRVDLLQLLLLKTRDATIDEVVALIKKKAKTWQTEDKALKEIKALKDIQ